MTNKRVLMLGPGEPSITNSGLGKAAEQIASQLSQKVSLTVIQPEDFSGLSKAFEEREGETAKADFSDFSVISDMVTVSISSTLSPYWYGEILEPVEEVKEEKSLVQKQLDEFSDQLVKSGKSADFDVIYAHDWLTFKGALTLKKLTGKPLVVHVHSLDYDRNAMYTGSWVFELEKDTFQEADHVIAVSNYSKKVLVDVYGVAADKISVIYHGHSKNTYPDFKNPYKERVVLFVGRLTGQKGPTRFLDIAEKVHEQEPNTRFIMAGEGELFHNLIEAGAHSKVANKFHLTGYLNEDELLKLYAMADVYCMPSVSEPFGLTAVEAANAGLPIVISKNAGAAEVLDGVITVDFNDTEGFANEVVRFLKNGSHTKNCVHLSKNSLNSLSWEKSGEQVYAILANA